MAYEHDADLSIRTPSVARRVIQAHTQTTEVGEGAPKVMMFDKLQISEGRAREDFRDI